MKAQKDNTPNLKDLKLKPAELDKFYLPFIKGGGLFIPTEEKNYQLGEEVFLKVELEGFTKPFRLICKVAWISAHVESKDWPRGIGVQFEGAEGKRLNHELQTVVKTMQQDKVQ